ncbi:hypothetical protein DPMN_071830 [Dreissena polymorpha]|uniref:Uncharacterized protein n=1 Tax=Dreissena polymorpha TaxID=45954 RepID=A0A9D3Z7G8_DREPO|nr:hypothetical protein DPMN_071830 [Dreissena polymorpha]
MLYWLFGLFKTFQDICTNKDDWAAAFRSRLEIISDLPAAASDAVYRQLWARWTMSALELEEEEAAKRFSIHFLLDRFSIFFDMSKNIGKEARPMQNYPTAPDHSCRPNQTRTRPLGRA